MAFNPIALLAGIGGGLNGYNQGVAQADAQAARDAQIKAAAEQAQREYYLQQQGQTNQQEQFGQSLAQQKAEEDARTQAQSDATKAAQANSDRTFGLGLLEAGTKGGDLPQDAQPNYYQGLNAAGSSLPGFKPYAVPGAPSGQTTPMTPMFGSPPLARPAQPLTPAGAGATLGRGALTPPLVAGADTSLSNPMAGGNPIPNPYYKPTLAGQATQADITATRSGIPGTPEYAAAVQARNTALASTPITPAQQAQFGLDRQSEADRVRTAQNQIAAEAARTNMEIGGQKALEGMREGYQTNQAKFDRETNVTLAKIKAAGDGGLTPGLQDQLLGSVKKAQAAMDSAGSQGNVLDKLLQNGGINPYTKKMLPMVNGKLDTTSPEYQQLQQVLALKRGDYQYYQGQYNRVLAALPPAIQNAYRSQGVTPSASPTPTPARQVGPYSLVR